MGEAAKPCTGCLYLERRNNIGVCLAGAWVHDEVDWTTGTKRTTIRYEGKVWPPETREERSAAGRCGPERTRFERSRWPRSVWRMLRMKANGWVR